MSFKEYGTIVEPVREQGTFKEFGEEIKPLSRAKSLLHASAAGAVERAGDIAGFFQRVLPFMPKGGLSPEKARKISEEKFPHFEKGPEKFLKRAGGLATEAALSPGGLAIKGGQIAAGTILGETAEALGAPEWAQSIAEGLPFFYSGGKKIPLKPDQKKLGNFLRREGLTEHEIAPLLKTPEQIARWSKYASKGGKSKKLMDSIYQKTGHIYDAIENLAAANPRATLDPVARQTLMTAINGIKNQMPHKYRNLIKQDLLDFSNSAGHFNDITNLYKDINAVVGAESGGRAIVGQFKGPIIRAMESADPRLAEDFKLVTDLYKTRANVASSLLNRKQLDDIIDAGELFTLGAAIFNRDAGLMTKVLGAAGGKRLAQEMLINPRLQNKSIRIGEALKKNKYTLATKLMEQFAGEIEKDDPELASLLLDKKGVKP